MAVQARFFVQSITMNATSYTTVVLSASTRGEENKEWAHYTPSGRMEINVISDSKAAEWFREHLSKDVLMVITDKGE